MWVQVRFCSVRGSAAALGSRVARCCVLCLTVTDCLCSLQLVSSPIKTVFLTILSACVLPLIMTRFFMATTRLIVTDRGLVN